MKASETLHRITSAFFALVLACAFTVVVPQHAHADEPSEPVDSVSPADSDNPVDPLDSDNPSNPVDLVNSVDFDDSDGPVEEAGLVRIYVMPFADGDAIIVECDNHFGVVDSGEDSSYPDGSDARYPLRDGVVIGGGHEVEMIAYMKSIGVTQDNLDFYIGTHPHSDHVGSASEIIHAFHPKTIYLPVYDDEMITVSAWLWDNQYVYDRFVEAALWAEDTYGARFIQHLDPNYMPDTGKEPVDPDPDEDDSDSDDPKGDDNEGKDNDKEEGGDKGDGTGDGSEGDKNPEAPGGSENNETKDGRSISTGQKNEGDESSSEGSGDDVDRGASNALKGAQSLSARQAKDSGKKPEDPNKPFEDVRIGSPTFMLGSAKIEILNYDESYQDNKVPDANYFSYGVKITAANGRTAFLAGDINNYSGAKGDGGVGDEDRLKNIIGSVDFLKLGHHGFGGSNSADYLNRILKQANGEDRCVVVQTGKFSVLPQYVVEILAEKDARYFSAPEMNDRDERAFVAELAAGGLKTNAEGDSKPVIRERDDAPLAALTLNGVFYKSSGWYKAESGRQYYFGVPGAGKDSAFALTDVWATLDSTKVYIDSNGEVTRYTHNSDPDIEVPVTPGSGLRGWQKYGDDWVFYDSKGALAKGWLKTGGLWYYLRPSGIMATGWEQVDGVWYYMSLSGAMQTGWVQHEGRWFFFDGSGAMKSGWVNTGGAWYYLAKSGMMLTGWQQIDGKWYYLKSSGAMVTGWQLIGGSWYYLNGSGAMHTGWIKSNGTWYYLHDSGYMLTGWQMVGNTWYYMSASGAMLTGWQLIGGTWYYLNGSGAMHTGWLYDRGTWYYLDPVNGNMQTGMKEVGGKTYLLASSGAMQTGWHKDKSHWRYFDGSGAMVKEKWVGNYYLGSDGIMLVDQWIGKYHVNKNGLWDDTKKS